APVLQRARFFFHGDDGIRAFHVTGVQTCALPISEVPRKAARRTGSPASSLITKENGNPGEAHCGRPDAPFPLNRYTRHTARAVQIGRASCRERAELPVLAGAAADKHIMTHQTPMH